MKIGELSKASGVSVDTIRYYERRGLIPAAVRAASGYRQYTSGDVARLRFIVQAKSLGFTLEEIGQLMALRAGSRSCAEVRAVAETKAAEIDGRIRQLARMRDVLISLAEQCEATGDRDSCPILKSLEECT